MLLNFTSCNSNLLFLLSLGTRLLSIRNEVNIFSKMQLSSTSIEQINYEIYTLNMTKLIYTRQ